MLETIQKKAFSIGDLYCVNEAEVRLLIDEIFNRHAYLADYLSLKPGSVVLDVGANIGIFSLFAIGICEGDVLIHSFEPLALSFACLKKNLEPFKQLVTLHNLGFSDVEQDCEAEFTVFGNSLATATYRPEDKLITNYQPLLNFKTLLAIAKFRNKPLYYQLKYLPFMRNYLIKSNYKKRTLETKVRCKLSSLSRFIEKNQLESIDFLKIDVEGAEMDVIKGIDPRQFVFIKQLSIEVHDIDHRLEKLSDYLQRQNYAIKIVSNPVLERLGFNHHMLYAKQRSTL